MGGNVSSTPSAPAAKGSASPVPSPSAPGFSGSLGSLGNALRGSTAPTQSMMGGKSSGAGQGGYGGAPGFQQPTAQNSPMQQSPFGLPPSSVYTSSFPNMPPPPSGGKSLGGVAPYGSAPGFGGQPFDPRFSPAQMENRSRFQGSRLEGDNIVDASGRRIGAIGMAAPTPTPQQDFVNPRGTMSSEMQAYYAQDRANQAERFNRFPQPMQQFNPYQQSPFNPYQQPMQQPGFSGLQDLFNMMMGQNMGGFNRPMPQYQSPASMYRPDMQRAQQNLSRVKPSVQRQRQDEQAARIRELEAELEGLRQPALQSYYDSGGGG